MPALADLTEVDHSAPHHSWLRTARLTFACIVAMIAAGALAGWALHIAPLTSVLPGLATMKVNTALCLGTGAAAVALLEYRAPWSRRAAAGSALLTLLLAAASLSEYATGRGFGIDQMLFRDTQITSLPFPGRMALGTALALVGAGLGLFLLSVGRSPTTVLVAHGLAVLPACCGFLALIGYAYGVDQMYDFGPFVSVALHTGLALALLSVAMLLIRHDEGWAGPFLANPLALATLLRISGLSLLVPFATGLLVVWGIHAGFYQAMFAPSLFAIGASGALLWLAFRSARILASAEHALRLSRQEANRRTAELASSRDRHEALIEGLPQLVWTCLPDGRCNYLSTQWVAYTGIPEVEQLGFGWLRAVDPRDLERTRQHWLDAVAGHHPYDIEYRLLDRQGGSRWFKTRGVTVRDAAGAPPYWFGTCTDIEDIVVARELLARSREELAEQVKVQTAELMAVEESLRQSQKMEAVGQLTGGLAHDFNNLLTGIMGSLELLQTRIAQGRLASIDTYVTAAQGAARRAASLTHRLLAFSRRQTLDPKLTDINRLVASMEDLIRRSVGPAIELEILAADDLGTVLIDPPQLESALLNLAINARDAMPDGGRLIIKTADCWLDEAAAGERDVAAGQYVSLQVNDTGVGMTADTIARAFDPFFTTKPLGVGTGLGLSMVYGFVRQSGGQALIQSQPGQGTAIYLYLPRYLAAPEIDCAPLPSPVLHAPDGGTVLIVDDEPSIRMLVSEVLSDLGYQALEAADGPLGLKLLQSQARVDLLITDVGLPGGMNGRQVADAARVLRPKLKVLFITGYAENAAIGGGGLDPGMHVLTKPFAMETLAARIRDLVAIP